MLLYFCLILFHMLKFLIINNIPLLNTLSILNIPNVSVFLRPIACFNSGTKFILLIDSAFFLSIKCLCGFHKPKKLLKPIDLKDHFEVFALVLFLPSFVFQLPVYMFGCYPGPPACTHWPGPGLISSFSLLFQWDALSLTLNQQGVSWGSLLPRCVLLSLGLELPLGAVVFYSFFL